MSSQSGSWSLWAIGRTDCDREKQRPKSSEARRWARLQAPIWRTVLIVRPPWPKARSTLTPLQGQKIDTRQRRFPWLRNLSRLHCQSVPGGGRAPPWINPLQTDEGACLPESEDGTRVKIHIYQRLGSVGSHRQGEEEVKCRGLLSWLLRRP